MKSILIYVGALVFILSACTQKKLSERDRKLQDRQQHIDVKKNELAPIIGVYYGKLTGEQDYQQNVKLVLAVKDIPEADGQTDPILIPRLVGSLRFLYGPEESSEYIDSTIKSAEYSKATKLLSVVITHQQFNEMVISATLNESELIGQWNATSLGVSGQIHLTRENK